MVNTRVLIRPAVLSDSKEMWTLERSVAHEGVIWGEVPTTKKVIKSRIGPLAFVAVVNDRLVGHIYGVVQKSENFCVFRKGQRYVELNAIFIRRNWRGRGVGKLLVKKLITQARKQGFRRFLVYTASKELERAIRIYRGAGFRTWCANLFIR